MGDGNEELTGAERIFHEVADLGSFADRAAYYARHGVSETVRLEVESLLRYDTTPTGECPDDWVQARVANAAAALVESKEGPDAAKQWGAYRMLRELGRGGMGQVFLAERVDGEVEQRVAIKLLQQAPYWGKAAGPVVLSRFLRERQILASLGHHPGIAQLLDAGHSPDGQPYLVMEYVDGKPIDAYLEDKPLQEKLDVFAQVCEAVAYAHQNLIVHRDLKPSNILVDARGRVKLLDFGIAKILVDLEEANGGQTVTRERMLTPEYASPEQVLGQPQTTATDVYSLGAVLYRLLTGKSPHVFGEEAGSGIRKSGLEIAICTVEPVRARKINATVPLDLDCIVHMALRKEPEARYRSVEALLGEIRAFQQKRPVGARGNDWWYRSERWVRRYWVPVTAAMLAIGGLSAGLVVAAHERAVAERRFAQVRQLANRFFALDRDLRGITGTTRVRQSVVASSIEYLAGLEAEIGRDVDLALEVGQAYLQVAQVQGVPVTPNLGDDKAADKTLQKAAAVADRVIQLAPGNVRGQMLAAQIAQSRMILYDNQRRDTEAVEEGAKAGVLSLQLLTGKDAAVLSPEERTGMLRVLVNAAQLHLNQHRDAEGIRYARAAAELAPPGAALQGQALSLLANGLRFQGELEEALANIRKARVVAEQLQQKAMRGEEDARLARDRENLLFATRWREGVILGEVGAVSLERWEEAAAALRAAMDQAESLAARDAADGDSRIRLATAARELTEVLTEMGQPEEALRVADHSLRRLGEMQPSAKVSIEMLRLEVGAAGALLRMRRFEEARRRISAADGRLAEAGGSKAVEPGSEAFVVRKMKAEWEAATGHPDRASDLYKALLEAMDSSGKAHVDLDLRHAVNYSGLYRDWAKVDPNGPASERRLSLWRQWEAKRPGNAFVKKQEDLAAKGR